MKYNNIIESRYIGWGILQSEYYYLHADIEVIGLKNISGSMKIKKVKFEITNNKKCCFRTDSPIICTINALKNQTLSKVNNISNVAV